MGLSVSVYFSQRNFIYETRGLKFTNIITFNLNFPDNCSLLIFYTK